MEYDTLTDQVNNTVSTSISIGTDWNAIPGGLEKVASSGKGFAWGIGSGKLWLCQLPCTGNWKKVDEPTQSTLKDIATDDEHIYALYQDVLAIKSSDNTDQWVTVDLPDSIEKIISTSSNIWGQVGDKKYKLPKPGMSGNWIEVNDKLNVKITSASATHLYGVKDGDAMVTDESMQSAWSVIPQFGGKYTAILGDADRSAIYGIEEDNSLQRCLNGKCRTIDTKGYTPQNITIEPTTKELWMTTTTPGISGNIFTQPVAPDYSDLLQKVKPIDAKRDQVVAEAEVAHDESTVAGIMSQQYGALKNMMNKLFEIKPVSTHEADKVEIQADINSTDYTMNVMKTLLPLIQDFLIVLGLVICTYAASDIFGDFTHYIAVGLMISGLFFIGIYK
jgi:hypothetical protein